MGRSRYKVYEPTTPHFMTYTILHRIPVFTRPKTVGIVFESLTYLGEAALEQIERGCIDTASHRRCSSAQDYESMPGLLKINPV